MTEREQLLTGILDDPECDTARLVYADWLEENAATVECGVCKGKRLVKRSKGGPDWYGRMGPESLPVKDCPTCSGSGRVSNGFAERAEFIRVQVELEKQRLTFGVTTPAYEFKTLDDRSLELLRAHGLDWFGSVVPGSQRVHLGENENVCGWTDAGAWWFRPQRGFISAISCSCADFLQHAAAIFREQPVTGVSLTDKEPLEWINGGGPQWEWWYQDARPSGPSNLPNHLLDVMWRMFPKYRAYQQPGRVEMKWMTFSTAADARDSLSAACVQLGKARARAARGTVGVGM